MDDILKQVADISTKMDEIQVQRDLLEKELKQIVKDHADDDLSVLEEIFNSMTDCYVKYSLFNIMLKKREDKL